jgi:hypothetical protein
MFYFVRPLMFIKALFLVVFSIALVGESLAQRGPVAILIPGAGGAVPQDFLMRNRHSISRAGIQTFVALSGSQAVGIASRFRGRRVVIVGMSRGALRTAVAIASGARISGAVFVAGNYRSIMRQLGSPRQLPRSLVVHHRQDSCRFTPPGAAASFASWSRGKVRIRWISVRGRPANRPCGPHGAHGFFGKDGGAVRAIISFVRSR